MWFDDVILYFVALVEHLTTQCDIRGNWFGRAGGSRVRGTRYKKWTASIIDLCRSKVVLVVSNVTCYSLFLLLLEYHSTELNPSVRYVVCCFSTAHVCSLQSDHSGFSQRMTNSSVGRFIVWMNLELYMECQRLVLN